MVRSRPARPLRRDAARNRQCILDAARAAFAEEGADVALEAIARRAGVGIATLYRRFPTRADLVSAAFELKLSDYVEAVDAAVGDPDPWHGLSDFVRRVCAMQAADAGFADVLALTFPPTRELSLRLREATAGLAGVIARAQEAGRVRADFVQEDLVVLLIANAGVVNATRRHAPIASERFARYMLDAFEASRADRLPEPLAPAQLALALRRARAER